MHIYFSGIGGTAIGPLALIAKQAGFRVSGSDKQASGYIDYLKKHGITSIHIGQTSEAIAKIHATTPIDWLVHSSAVDKENPNHPELVFAAQQGIKTSKRDELINLIVKEKKLKMIAIAGTQGKTTTTAMVIWLFKQLDVPISYSVGAKINFGDMGQYEKNSEFFVYEADEFDRNFLAFEPHLSIITGVSWDHHEIFPTREDYQQAFKEFIDQSDHTILWQEDYDYLGLTPNRNYTVEDSGNPHIHDITLPGLYNRLDGWLAVQAVRRLTNTPLAQLIDHISNFPGSSRRMEQIVSGLYSDYAHTPEKIRGAMSIAQEIAAKKGQRIVVVYEPIGNRRQHYVLDNYQDCFSGATQVYWVPTYLVREDPNQHVLTPSELISHLSDPSIATPAAMDTKLKQSIQEHLKNGDMVVAMSAGGGHSLDEWIRQNFVAS
jgi:UDP-N-acetylmuramate--alanine ligase